MAEKRTVSRYPVDVKADDRTFGQRLADKVAVFGGSWTFIIIFGCILLFWAAMNTFVLSRYGDDFDPYPYILLNLFLSMLASIQAPIIMMSQNRQAAKDRLEATHDYEVNLKSELEIIRLHEKIDELRETQWSELIEISKKANRIPHSSSVNPRFYKVVIVGKRIPPKPADTNKKGSNNND